MREFSALAERHKTKEEWLNYRAGLICSVMANLWRDRKKKVKPFTPQDFMPGVKRERQTPEQMLATVQMLNAAFGGTVMGN